MNSALVTGGLGFIGSHLAERLVRDGVRVRVLDNLDTGNESNVAAIANDCDVTIGSIEDESLVNRCLDGVDTIYHLAAISSVPRLQNEPDLGHRINLSASLRMMTLAQTCGVKRFVFASSASVYGNGSGSMRSETDVKDPLSVYAITKSTSEDYARALSSQGSVEYVMMRFFNAYGPRQSNESAAAVASFLRMAHQDRTLVIFGDGDQTRDFVYVDDVVDLCARIGKRDSLQSLYNVVNVGCGQETSINDLAKIILRVSGKSLPVAHEEERSGDVRFSRADIGQAQDLFGYRPSISVLDGIQRTWDWITRTSNHAG